MKLDLLSVLILWVRAKTATRELRIPRTAAVLYFHRGCLCQLARFFNYCFSSDPCHPPTFCSRVFIIHHYYCLLVSNITSFCFVALYISFLRFTFTMKLTNNLFVLPLFSCCQHVGVFSFLINTLSSVYAKPARPCSMFPKATDVVCVK